MRILLQGMGIDRAQAREWVAAFASWLTKLVRNSHAQGCEVRRPDQRDAQQDNQGRARRNRVTRPRNVPKLEGWLTRVARKRPAKAADILLRTLECRVPKLGRPLTGPGGAPLMPTTKQQADLAGLNGAERQQRSLARAILFHVAILKDLEANRPEAMAEAGRIAEQRKQSE